MKLERKNKIEKRQKSSSVEYRHQVKSQDSVLSVLITHLRVKIQETKSARSTDNTRHDAFGKCIVLLDILEKRVECRRQEEETEDLPHTF